MECGLQPSGHWCAGDLRRCGMGVHAQALAAGIHLELGMQQLQLGQARRLVPIVARVTETRGEIHGAQQLHAVQTGVGIAECHLGFEQFRRTAAQLLEEAHRALAWPMISSLPKRALRMLSLWMASKRRVQPRSLRGGGGMASSTRLISAETPVACNRGTRTSLAGTGQHRQTSAGAVGMQHVDRAVHMAAHARSSGDHVAGQR